MKDLIPRPSPNFNERPKGKPVDILLLHYTGLETAEAALDRLCDPEAKVSAHYTVDEDGTVYVHVSEDHRAWHAGVSSWRGDSDVNGRSVGIELVNPGHEFGYRRFPEAQMTALEDLAQNVLGRQPIPPRNVVGHGDVAPGRKQDPGELFDWAGLAAKGIGLWPRAVGAGGGPTLRPGDSGREVTELQRRLIRFGYGVKANGAYDSATQLVVEAFQRHFRPSRFDGVADAETVAILDHLLDRIG